MIDQRVIRERYLRDKFSIRLGGLAANLSPITSFSNHRDHREIVESLLEESTFFIEWTAPDAELKVQAELVDLQLQLARWKHRWEKIWADPVQRAAVAKQAYLWSKRMLEISGLLP